MVEQGTTNRFAIVALATAVLLSGCGTTEKVGDWLRGKDNTPVHDQTLSARNHVSRAVSHVRLLQLIR